MTISTYDKNWSQPQPSVLLDKLTPDENPKFAAFRLMHFIAGNAEFQSSFAQAAQNEFRAFEHYRHPNLETAMRKAVHLLNEGGAHESIDHEDYLGDVFGLLVLAGIPWDQIVDLMPRVVDGYLARKNAMRSTDHPHLTTPGFADAMRIQRDEVVLDPLTGDGRQFLNLAVTHPGSTFIGMDRDPQRLLGAVTKAAQKNLDPDRVWFARQHPSDPYLLPDASVHKILIHVKALKAYTHAQTTRFFREMLRILKLDGMIGIDGLLQDSPSGREAITALEEAVAERNLAMRRNLIEGPRKVPSLARTFAPLPPRVTFQQVGASAGPLVGVRLPQQPALTTPK